MFISSPIQTCGIQHRTICLYSHAQNSNVERRHRHIVDIELTLLSHASILYQHWGEAFQTVVYLINCMPTPLLKNSHPFKNCLALSLVIISFVFFNVLVALIYDPLINIKLIFDPNNVFLLGTVMITKVNFAFIFQQVVFYLMGSTF